MKELEALLALSHIPLLGAVKIRLLIHHFGSALAAFSSDTQALAELPGFGSKIVESFSRRHQSNAWREDLEMANNYRVELVAYTDSRFPKRLLELPDHPNILYVLGSLHKQDERSIAVVGTRAATIYGLEIAEGVSRELTQYGYTVVSGLARGVDTRAHQGALANGRTLAVIGSGLSQLYPPENRDLAAEIVERGALISELPMKTPPDRRHFPQRNRIVSGMTLGTLLIEAPLKSGAMITMRRGLAQGRKLFAIPGRADTGSFSGNHLLIKEGKAVLIEKAEDVVNHFEDLFSCAKIENLDTNFGPRLEIEEQYLLDQMPAEELTIDELVTITQLPVSKLNVLLMCLVLKKRVKEFPGKLFRKKAVR